ncbi:hypothetical protein [Nocardia sp. NBC_01388]|uniref:hypothetical protein n=1 Tax=Nocardia sp. NBC_01388 TaxID=2903596 RepID=UPI0032443897
MSPSTMTAAVLAVSQPTADGGPFEQIASKFLGLLWAFSGWVALASFLVGAAVYAYQKATMQQSSVTSWLMGILVLVFCGAAGATIVNWAMGS